MRKWADFSIIEGEGGTRRLELRGPLLVSSVGRIDAALRGSDEQYQQIDLSQAGEVDTVGAWTVWRLARDSRADIVGASDKARRLIAAVHRNELSEEDEPEAELPAPARRAMGVDYGLVVQDVEAPNADAPLRPDV